MKPNKEKSQLLTALQTLLQKHAIETQEELCDILAKKGFAVNQAMVSRTLHKLGAIKMNESGKVVYRLPVELHPITATHSLSQLVLQIANNKNLIVIRTAPGSAQLVARLLDQQAELGILGCLAGDDTIFVAPKSLAGLEELERKISAVLLGSL